LGPAERYRRWLAVRRGLVRVVAGTRAAMFAPVADLGLVVLWDDGDDLHAEPRAPYPNAREVLALRAHKSGAAALIGGFARTGEARAVAPGGPPGAPAPGPVLVQVPRRGYLAAIACGRCRAQARCATCGGPLEIGGSHETPGCRWCGALATDWTCARCGSG